MNFGQVFVEVFPSLLEGLMVTVQVTIISLLIAIVLGLVTCLMGLSSIKIFKGISKFFVWVIRGTPFIVQLFFIYFGIAQLIQSFGINFSFTSFTGAVITLSLNAGAYMSEIFRGGILAVDKGQMEAARSLGLPKRNAMAKIILPQALRICFPSLCNQFIITLKDTSLAQVIGLAEIVYKGKIYVGRSMQAFATYALIGVVYLFLISILQWVAAVLERRLNSEPQN